MEAIVDFQDVDREFIEKYKERFGSKMWRKVSQNVHKFGGTNFIRDYKELLNWNSLTINYNFTADEIDEFLPYLNGDQFPFEKYKDIMSSSSKLYFIMKNGKRAENKLL